ncbi:MAG TPA: transglutaminase-like cysteine peptidase [Stellaceae bacterium]|nr:transglutaminase-like cysteine peptidase [Stellaceae bacterium]
MRFLRFFALLLALAVPLAWIGTAPAAISARPSLFGTEEVFSPDNSAFTKWTDMLRRFNSERRRGAPAEWQTLVASLRGLDPRTRLERVNAVINGFPYTPSMVNWGERNHWETPFEFLRKSGQCQDYAIAKYMLLRDAGVPAASLRLVVLRDTRQSLDHAVLVAYLDGEPMLLDNQIGAVVPTAAIGYYQPYYSISEDGWWLHRGANARYAALR